MTHLIGKQILNLIIRDKTNPYALQQQLYELYWDVLVPAIDELFDELSTTDEIIRIDSLQVDLGNIDFEKIDKNEIAEQMIAQLRNNIKEQLKFENGGSNLIIPLRQRHFNQWMHWLRHGYMQGTDLFAAADWQKSILDSLGLSSAQVLQLQLTLQRDAIALRRLVEQHSSSFLISLVELYTGHKQADLLIFHQEIKSLFRLAPKKSNAAAIIDLEKATWQVILHKTVIQRNKLKPAELARTVLCQPSIWPTVKTLVDQVGPSATEPLPFTELKMLGPIIADLHKEPKALAEHQLPTIDWSIDQVQAAIEAPIFFANAGVVLVHPFLPLLFEKLKLTKGKKFSNAKKQSKAILIIHYLATGNDDTKDFHLLLPKLLCGMPFNQPIDHRLRLSKKEKSEADKLLLAAIEHWGALGEVSQDALREGFLMRNGKLEQSSGNWKLFLEQKPIDLLLDRLPWGMGMIKLPWMQEMLSVDWR